MKYNVKIQFLNDTNSFQMFSSHMSHMAGGSLIDQCKYRTFPSSQKFY